jgi:hypothetical protein
MLFGCVWFHPLQALSLRLPNVNLLSKTAMRIVEKRYVITLCLQRTDKRPSRAKLTHIYPKPLPIKSSTFVSKASSRRICSRTLPKLSPRIRCRALVSLLNQYDDLVSTGGELALGAPQLTVEKSGTRWGEHNIHDIFN